MAGVMGLAPTCLQRDGLASRLLRLHAQWLPRQDSHLFDLVQSLQSVEKLPYAALRVDWGCGRGATKEHP